MSLWTTNFLVKNYPFIVMNYYFLAANDLFLVTNYLFSLLKIIKLILFFPNKIQIRHFKLQFTLYNYREWINFLLFYLRSSDTRTPAPARRPPAGQDLGEPPSGDPTHLYTGPGDHWTIGPSILSHDDLSGSWSSPRTPPGSGTRPKCRSGISWWSSWWDWRVGRLPGSWQPLWWSQRPRGCTDRRLSGEYHSQIPDRPLK